MDTKTRMLEAQDWIEKVEARLLSRLTREERDRRGDLDHWSPKDIIAHVTAWRQNMLQTFRAGAPESGVQPPDESVPANTHIYMAYRDLPWAEIENFNRQALDEMRSIVQQHTAKDLTDPKRFPFLEGQALWRRVAGNLLIHPVTHYGQLLNDLGRQKESLDLQLEAAEMLLRLDDDPNWQGVTRYNRACAYALAGMRAEALADLRRALQLNPGLTEWSKEDSDLVSLHGDPAYEAVYRA